MGSFVPKRGHPWPADTRERALAIYVADGPTAVLRALGVPAPTVVVWAKKLGLSAPYREPSNKREHPLTPSDQEYHRVWFATYGSGPWLCGWCDRDVVKIGRRRGEGNIHHLNHDHDDNRLENLEMLHHECHTRKHHLGVARRRREEGV